MKATITKEGVLKINAESSLEAYALQNWFLNYHTGNESSALSISTEFCIETDYQYAVKSNDQ